ncbi:CD276 protein, partial [Polyodon spathula]|nr:CD276 protein [Polyodon spathula]
ITAARDNDIWLDCTFDAARMRQDKSVWWYHCYSDVCTEIQHFRDGMDQLQHGAGSRRSQIYPDKFKDGKASLFIENVQMSDEGHYECNVILTEGLYSKISVLTVLASSEPPQLTEALDTRSFTCSSRNGFPPALVAWTGGSGMNYTPDSVTQHTLNPEGLYDVVSKLTRTRQNHSTLRKRIFNFSDDAVIVLIGRPHHAVPSLINSCVFAYKADEPFKNLAGADKEHPHYALLEEVPLTEHITITRALLEKEDRFWTDEREAYLDKWRKEAQNQRSLFVFVHSCMNKPTATAIDEIQRLFEDVKSVSGSYPFTALTMKNFQKPDELKPFFEDLGSKWVFSFHNYTVHDHQRNAKRDEEFLDFVIACIDETCP